MEVPHGHFFRSEGNFSLNVGDDKENVLKNRRRAAEALGFSRWITGGVVHGATIAHVKEDSTEFVGNCDGLITDIPGIALMMTWADCQVALFYDPVRRAVGVAHAGWRGQCQNIYAKIVRRMKEVFGSSPTDLRVSISPSLGQNRGEFVNYRSELPESFWQFQVKPNYFDLWAVAKWQLLELGLQEKHLHFSRICSYDNPDLCFSFRRDEKKTGRNASIIGIKY